MGGSLHGIQGAVVAATKGMSGVSQTMKASMEAIAGSGDQRAAFNAVLLATVANVEKKPNFNLELEINDLWTRLGNLRGMASAASAGGAFKQIPAQMSSIGNLLESALQVLAKGAAK